MKNINWSLGVVGSALAFLTGCGSSDAGNQQGAQSFGGFMAGDTGGSNGVLQGAGGFVGTTPAGSGGFQANGAGGVPSGGVFGAGGQIIGAGGTGVAGQGTATGGAGVGGGTPGSCCSDGNCLCHGGDPTEDSAGKLGPYPTQSYTSGFRDGPSFLAGTIYYPTGDAAPPFAGVVVCPGWTAVQSSIAQWGPFLASYGIVTMTIDTNTTGDSVAQRADALWDALTSLKAENTRADSPIAGKLDAVRYGLMGWSMGGGGTWIDAAKHPELKSAISLAGHDATAGGATIATGTTVPSMMFCGAQDNPILGGGGQSQGVYGVIPATTPKILYEMSAEGHFSWGTPLTTGGGALGRYGLAFQKLFLEGDTRYKFILLKQGPGASAWTSNVQ